MAARLTFFKTNFNWRAIFAEFLAMTLFVFIGCGTAMMFQAPNNFNYKLGADVALNFGINANFGVVTALAFGFAITSLIFTIGHISGGHINSSVSWGMFLCGKLDALQLVGYTIAQFAGSVLGAALLFGTLPFPLETNLGANSITKGAFLGNAVLGEMVMTFVLVFTVLMVTSESANLGTLAAIPIGLAVFCGHAVLIPLDGCSINPSRSFGPALLSGKWSDFWVFIVGPYGGSTLAAIVYRVFDFTQPKMEGRKRFDEGGLQDIPLEESASTETLADLDRV